MICFKGNDFLLNNVPGDESWFHPKKNCCISKEAVVAVVGLWALQVMRLFTPSEEDQNHTLS
jgi:hypothetical protein